MTPTFSQLGNTAQRNQYLTDSVLSAPPARLLTMLYDRLLLDLTRAEADQNAANWSMASVHLLHAQAILTELSSSLKVDAWDGASGLLGIYNYASTALINANIQRDAGLTREAIDLLEPLRQTWHEAAASISAATPAAPAAPAAPASVAAFPASARGTWDAPFPSGGGTLGVA
ncbi:flagellar protein FliS [Pseudarthrobacter chlorophenolicus A6]|uniref:Flagellar protein FliS n=1 Tax=Pseudarthrobacter chlorophenolicus (strain ATCC 700700 / DSM 12829 / CIP 107037 / JCM 12360 / KCTC 9906 / NCIMB 13794 / A6) TaxID=452863 RepID=B8HEL2_PSECP|nr:flagellar export chaperone FliS [Pseudarthrobacter chlorophenolicus]ACL40957.1 flagellar protein FliS [Pseudarthrobacter chlorophenolicus A6]SDQ72241.1 flagellar protein FliS [Pseudarthrobacter chlorophenolicus]